ncbi:flagellar hook-length control protein FliK [Methylotenera sp.]|uniref:flagellar hook-length control protein FliK n=1 Tax=Methylotenera sp. TaxID=2051956 RepID=UPI00248A415E|nr:flagellar hook-length control protein FliK [Methylotenera sp.]MDI1361358.1 flagellar hook-length control protein FliK [Methylotenera sp.]
MLKQTDIASINPVARILPILAVESIGSIRQELADRATQFVKGQEYFAHVISKVGDTAYNVKVESGSLKGTILKMDLGTAAKAGQLLTLRYMHDNPVPTFLLASTPTNAAGSTTEISSAANLIRHYLKQAESDGVTSRFQATAVVTNSPSNPQVMAHDLKNAVSNSGLFYESHLSDLVQSNQSLAAIKQEPQNQVNSPIANLMSQQLAILENQRMSWHGEVWPGQKMDWDVYQQPQNADGKQPSNQSQADQDRPITSEMILHLPHLGKVSARISLIDGRMRVNILAEHAQTLEVLTAKRLGLAEAIGKNGQQLDALTVVRHE